MHTDRILSVKNARAWVSMDFIKDKLFSIAMGAYYSFYVKTIETHARAFLALNIFAISSVRLLFRWIKPAFTFYWLGSPLYWLGLKNLKILEHNVHRIILAKPFQVELVSKELNHFGGILSVFQDWAPGTLTGREETKVYLPPVSVPGAQSWKNDTIPT